MAHRSCTYTQRNDLVRPQGEDQHVQTRKRRLTRNQICLQLDHEHPASRSVKKQYLSHLACDILLWLPQQGCSKNQRARHLGMSLPQRGESRVMGEEAPASMRSCPVTSSPGEARQQKMLKWCQDTSVQDWRCRKNRGQETGVKP